MEETKDRFCECKGNCLNVSCPFFKVGKYCPDGCKCPNCRNKPQYENERRDAYLKILTENPMALTSEDSITQSDYISISSFAMLTQSVNSEPFKLKKEEKTLSKVMIPKVLELSVVTILSAANETLDSSKSPKSFEEDAENAVALEFQNILKKIESVIDEQNS